MLDQLDLDGLDLDNLIPHITTEEKSNILETAVKVFGNLGDFDEFMPNADNLSSNVPTNTNEDTKPATFRAFVSQPIPKVLQYSETQQTFHIKSGGRFPLQIEAASKYKTRLNIFTRDISTQAFSDLAPRGTLHIKLELKRTEQEYEKCPIDKVDSRYVKL